MPTVIRITVSSHQPDMSESEMKLEYTVIYTKISTERKICAKGLWSLRNKQFLLVFLCIVIAKYNVSLKLSF